MSFRIVPSHFVDLSFRKTAEHQAVWSTFAGWLPIICFSCVINLFPPTRRLRKCGIPSQMSEGVGLSHHLILRKVGMGLTVFARVWLNGQNEETVAPFVKAI